MLLSWQLANKASQAPGSRGVDPWVLTTVTSTAGAAARPCSRSAWLGWKGWHVVCMPAA